MYMSTDETHFSTLTTKQMRLRLCSRMIFCWRLELLILALGLYSGSEAQRLSQGASDWYMRFYSNMDYVKRNVDRPVTKSFAVTSDIQYRYATTKVTTVVHNPANVAQNYTFGFVMPKDAFVSNVTIELRKQPADGTMPEEMDHDVQVVQGNVNMSDFHREMVTDVEEEDFKIDTTHHQQRLIRILRDRMIMMTFFVFSGIIAFHFTNLFCPLRWEPMTKPRSP